MRIAVAIPVYKRLLSDDERLSLRQYVKILGHYDTFLVCPEGLDVTEYEAAAGCPLATMRFAPTFFDGIEGYNRLMKSQGFYCRFRSYDYLLIYQLDAWVFCDQLTEWCHRGYDYVGAPWFDKHKSHEEGYALWCAGNGGLSLRKVKTFIHVTNPRLRVKSCREVFKDEYHSIHDLGHCLARCLSPLIGNNTIDHYMNKGEGAWMYEDGFFSYGLAATRHRLNIPSPVEAAFFSFELSPRYLYEEVTHHQLPFGCHAWRKYQYEDFWRQFIP